MIVKRLKKTIYVLCGAAALISVSSHSVKAQHVVTENEAAKLTLDSLTAKPVVRYHAKRASHYSSVRKVSYTTRSGSHNKKLVRAVSYKHAKSNKVSVRNAVYNVSSSHKKTSVKRRHRS